MFTPIARFGVQKGLSRVTKREFFSQAEACGDPAQSKNYENRETVYDVSFCPQPQSASNRNKADQRGLRGKRRLALEVEHPTEKRSREENTYGDPEAQ